MGSKAVIERLDLLEQELKCVICLSVFDDPHSLPCNHQFCYECIEHLFRVKSQCPLCKLPTFKRAIIKNQVLSNVVTAFLNLRETMSKLPEGSQLKSPIPSPSPKKRNLPVLKEEPTSNKRTRRSLHEDEKPEPTTSKHQNAQGCMDFTLVLETTPKIRHSPRKTTNEIATQTMPIPFDPYIRTNNQTTSNHASNQIFSTTTNNANVSPEYDPYDIKTLDDVFEKKKKTIQTINDQTTPTRTSPNAKIDLKNITDWNSLKKTKPTTPTTPTSPHHPRNGTPNNNPRNGTPNNKITSPSRTNGPNGTTPSRPQTTTSTTTNTTSPKLVKTPNPTESTTVPTTNGKNTSPSANGTSKTETSLQTPMKIDNPEPVANKPTNDVAKLGNGLIAPKPKPKSKCKKVVILPTSIDPDMIANSKAILKELGGTMVSKYSPEVTHIVAGLTGAFSARRTIKYCLGVLQGKWVVCADWLVQSRAAHYWVAEDAFEVEGDSVTQGGPKSAREAIENNSSPLFTNCQIYLLGEFTSPTKAEFKKLLQIGGAEVSAKTPAKKISAKTKKGTTPSQTEVIVCNPTHFSTLPKEEVERVKSLGRVVADARWVLDCVSFYRILPFSEYELSG